METVDTRTFKEKMEAANEKVKDLARKGIDYATEQPVCSHWDLVSSVFLRKLQNLKEHRMNQEEFGIRSWESIFTPSIR